MQNGNKNLYYFTKFHSKFTVFPKGSLVVIANVPFVEGIILSSFHYQLVDSNKLHTLPPMKYTGHQLAMQTLILTESSTILVYLHLKVRALYRIKAKWANKYFKGCLVYDGPGLASKLLSPFRSNQKRTEFRSTTFQVVMYLLLPLDSIDSVNKNEGSTLLDAIQVQELKRRDKLTRIVSYETGMEKMTKHFLNNFIISTLPHLLFFISYLVQIIS